MRHRRKMLVEKNNKPFSTGFLFLLLLPTFDPDGVGLNKRFYFL